jgi:hypothetical protein
MRRSGILISYNPSRLRTRESHLQKTCEEPEDAACCYYRYGGGSIQAVASSCYDEDAKPTTKKNVEVGEDTSPSDASKAHHVLPKTKGENGTSILLVIVPRLAILSSCTAAAKRRSYSMSPVQA